MKSHNIFHFLKAVYTFFIENIKQKFCELDLVFDFSSFFVMNQFQSRKLEICMACSGGMTNICTSGGIYTSIKATTCTWTKYVQVVARGGSGGKWWQIYHPIGTSSMYL